MNTALAFSTSLALRSTRLAALIGSGLLLSASVHAVQFELVHKLTAATLGKRPVGELTQGADGKLYGTTTWGGAHNKGSLFIINRSGHPQVLHSFGDAAHDGWNGWPVAPLLAAEDGSLYGTLRYGGTSGDGGLYTFNPATGYELTQRFTKTDGAHPTGLIWGPDGLLYGSTVDGGTRGLGTVFSSDRTGRVSVLHEFSGGADGRHPAGITLGADGRLMVVTNEPSSKTRPHGRVQSIGVIFSMALDGSGNTLVHRFADRTPEGMGLYQPLLLAVDGNYYGTSRRGGLHAGCCGVVFKMTPQGQVDILHTFAGHADGAYPSGRLAQAADGTIYGTTTGFNTGLNSGAYPGTLYAITAGGNHVVRYQFGWGDASSFPTTGVTVIGNALYGMTTQHSHDFSARIGGAVYRITP
jgi:uncharacterized repeat protein (TIGR03803 family)